MMLLIFSTFFAGGSPFLLVGDHLDLVVECPSLLAPMLYYRIYKLILSYMFNSSDCTGIINIIIFLCNNYLLFNNKCYNNYKNTQSAAEND